MTGNLPLAICNRTNGPKAPFPAIPNDRPPFFTGGQRTYLKLVLFALNKTAAASYTIYMKTKQLPLTILFGLLFAVAGGNVFAGEALDQLKDWADTTAPASDVKIDNTTNKTKLADLAKDTKGITKGVGDVKATVAPPAPAPTPIKDFISENKTTIFGAGLGAYLGFALFGPIGILLGAIFMIGFIKMAAV